MADPNQPQPYQLPPNYPPPQRTGLPGWAIALIVGGVLLVFLCIGVAVVSIGALTLLGGRVSQVFSTINSDLIREGQLASTPTDTAGALAIGETATLPQLLITVGDAHPLTDLRGARPPTAGNEYWAVEVTFENTSDQPLALSVFSSSVQDAEGKVYPYSIPAQRASPDPGLPVVVSLQPGKTASGILFYMVPQDARELFWLYRDVAGGGQALFRIKEAGR
jgi:Flp pilus assembly pilin Flp